MILSVAFTLATALFTLPAVQAAPYHRTPSAQAAAGVSLTKAPSSVTEPSYEYQTIDSCPGSTHQRRGKVLGACVGREGDPAGEAQQDQAPSPYEESKTHWQQTVSDLRFAWPRLSPESQQALYDEAISPFLVEYQDLFHSNHLNFEIRADASNGGLILKDYQVAVNEIDIIQDADLTRLDAANTKVNQKLDELKATDPVWAEWGEYRYGDSTFE